MHATGDDAIHNTTILIRGLAQFGQFRAELIEQTGEAFRGRLIGGADISLRPLGADDQIDRSILQMQPPVRQ